MDWQNFRLEKRLNLNNKHIEEIYSLIARIDAVKNSFVLNEKFTKYTIDRLTSSVIITSTGASNRIEGNRLTDAEIEKLYKNLRVKKFKTRDEEEVAGYLEILEIIFSCNGELDISESQILSLHNETLKYSEADSHHRGKYKTGSNRVEAKDQSGNLVGVIFDPTSPHLVSKEMQELVLWFNNAIEEEKKHNLIIIANFIFEYLAIHPFQDGNGRTSRLLTNILLLKYGYDFTKIVSHEELIESQKADYYLALNRTQKSWKTEEEDISAWLLFFLKVIAMQAEKSLEIAKNDDIKYLLSEKQLEIWDWINKREEEFFTRKETIEFSNFPSRTVEYIIKKFINMNKLERVGLGKEVRYKLK